MYMCVCDVCGGLGFFKKNVCHFSSLPEFFFFFNIFSEPEFGRFLHFGGVTFSENWGDSPTVSLVIPQ